MWLDSIPHDTDKNEEFISCLCDDFGEAVHGYYGNTIDIQLQEVVCTNF